MFKIKQKKQREMFEKLYEKFSFCPPWQNKSVYIGMIVMLEKSFIKPPQRVLDIGCGNGWNLDYLSKAGFEVYGIDFSYIAIKFARKTYNVPKIAVADVMRLPFKEASFSLIIDIGLLHCINPTERIIVKKEIKRILRKKGNYLVSEFFRNEKKLYKKPIFYAFVEKIGKSQYKIPGHLQIPTWGFNLNDINALFSPDFLIKRYFYWGDHIIVLMEKIN